ncbi:HEPN domain-containing protein [Labilibaculum sp.]|uniref:HEPN domain-containing protein n=1 Tax=Labilibaculum sp. TaxID=2060723 RepID=UPI002AA79745|nr:HEPN domain-containing protein [Labilibaculum sp.]
MNNQEALTSIENCEDELQRIFHLIEGHGHMSSIVPFLTNYAIVKSCGTAEFCFKTIISDIHSGQSSQIVNYVDNTIRNSSMNPSLDNICKTLKKFDPAWNDLFKDKLSQHEHNQRIKSSLDSLNTARNTFAHGRTPVSSFENIRTYFGDTVEVLKLLDEVVNE